MKKSKKLELNDLKVQSFITAIDSKKSRTVGGQVLPSRNMTCPVLCNWQSELNTACYCTTDDPPCSLAIPCTIVITEP